jgi:hypothetical protein
MRLVTVVEGEVRRPAACVCDRLGPCEHLVDGVDGVADAERPDAPQSYGLLLPEAIHHEEGRTFVRAHLVDANDVRARDSREQPSMPEEVGVARSRAGDLQRQRLRPCGIIGGDLVHRRVKRVRELRDHSPGADTRARRADRRRVLAALSGHRSADLRDRRGRLPVGRRAEARVTAALEGQAELGQGQLIGVRRGPRGVGDERPHEAELASAAVGKHQVLDGQIARTERIGVRLVHRGRERDEQLHRAIIRERRAHERLP